jgi:hypothetical protein
MGDFGFTAFGEDAFGSFGGAPTAVLSDGIGMITHERSTAATFLRAAFGAGETTVSELIKTLSERIRLTGNPLPSSQAFAGLTDGVAFEDAMALVWKVAIEEGIDLVGSAAGSIRTLAVLVDTLHATGAVATRLDAIVAVSNAIGINSLIAAGWKMEAIDSIGFQEALAGQLHAMVALTDGAGFDDVAAPSLRITAITSAGIGLAGSPATQLQTFVSLSDGVVFYVVLRLGAVEYAGWVLHDGAPTEYRNYPFNGFVEFPPGSKRYLGTSSTGLYRLEGDTDAGTDIDAAIKTALMDFGTGRKKRVPEVYLAFAGADTVVLKVITTTDTGTQVENHFTATVPGGAALHNGRIKVGRGLDATYWQWELCNTDGGALELDELAFRPIVLDRRL